MQYLFSKIGFTMLAAALIASFLEKSLCAGAAVLLLAAGIVCAAALKNAKTAGVCLISAAAGFALVFISLLGSYYPAKALGGMNAEIEGIVTEISAGNGKAVYTVETSAVHLENAPQKLKLKLSGFGEFDLAQNDKIKCSVLFYTSSGENLTDTLSDRSGGVSVYAFMNSQPEVTGHGGSGIAHMISSLRGKISDIIDSLYPGESAALMRQMLIGVKSEDSAELRDSFRRAGISHILVISGAHLMMITGSIEKFITFRRKRTLKLILLFAVAALYMAVSGFGLSVLRAGFTYFVYIITRLLYARSAKIDNLGIAVAVILVINPLACCDVGFLMSVSATAGIIFLQRPIATRAYVRFPKLRRGFWRFAWQSFSVSVAASVFALPISMLAFGGTSVLAPITGIFAAIFAKYMLIFGFLSVIFGAFPLLNMFAAFAAFLARICENLLCGEASFFAELPFAYIETKYEWMSIWILGTLVLFALPLLIKKSTKYIKYSAVFSSFVLVFGVLVSTALYSGTVNTEIIPLCEGMAVRCSKNGSAVLITSGMSMDDYNRLGIKGGKADILVCLDSKNTPSELEAARELLPKTAVFTYEDSAERFENSAAFESGTLNFWEDASVQILNKDVFAVDTGEISILYISEKCDIMELEPRYRRASIVILDGVSPEGFSVLRPKYTLVCGEAVPFGTEGEIISLGESEASFRSRGENIRKAGFWQ